MAKRKSKAGRPALGHDAHVDFWASATVAREMAARAEQLGVSTAQAWRLAADTWLRIRDAADGVTGR